MPRKKQAAGGGFIWPEIEIGGWRGEFTPTPNGSIGQTVQPGPPRRSVEFTYLIIGASVVMPVSKFRWPAVVTFFVPTPMKPDRPDAGFMFRPDRLPSLNLGFEIAREQYSDICWLFREKRLNEFHFTVEDATSDKGWPLKSWGASFQL